MAHRIYIVTVRTADPAAPQPKPRLVRAHSQAQAVRHVARDYQATVASQEDLVSALTAQIPVETAGDDTKDTDGGGA